MRTTTLTVLTAALLLLCSSPAQDTERQAFMVWDARCLSAPRIDKDTKLEAPMVNGEPDMKQARLLFVKVTFNRECGHVEIRKVK